MLENLRDMFYTFMDMTCALWIPVAVGVEKTAREESETAIAKADRRVMELTKLSELELMEEKERARRKIAEVREKIEVEEAKLAKADEKDLLVQTVMALNGYGTRLDRLEDAMTTMGRRMKYMVGAGMAPVAGEGKEESASLPLWDRLREELDPEIPGKEE